MAFSDLSFVRPMTENTTGKRSTITLPGQAAVGIGPAWGPWIMVVAGMMVTSSLYVINSFSVFFPSLAETFGWSRADIASAYSAFAVCYSLSVIPMGRLAEMIGPRLVTLLAALLVGSGLFLASRVETIWQLRLTTGVLVGLGSGAVWTIPMLVVTQWFQGNRRRGLALGMTASGALGIMFPLLGSSLIASAGWRNTYVIVGLATAAVLAIAAWLLRPPPASGLGANTGSKGRMAPGSWGLGVLQTLKTRQFWILYTAYGLGFLALSIPLVHLVPIARDRLVPEVVAAGALTAALVFSVGGRLLIGAISDRVSGRLVIAASYVVQALSLLWLLFSDHGWMLYLFAFGLGASWGGWVAVYPSIFGQYFGLRRFSTIFAIATSNVALGGVVGPYFAGYLFDTTGSYTAALIAGAVICLGAAALCFFLRPPAPDRSTPPSK